MTTKKMDCKKECPELYKPSAQTISIVEVPRMKYFMVDGQGDPNNSNVFSEAVELLYGVSYSLKMKVIKPAMPTKDYVVPPLEGLWYMDRMDEWRMEKKEQWQWTLMIRIPDFAISKHIEKARTQFIQKKPDLPHEKLYIEDYNEGKCIQILYIGPYDDEPSTIAKMHSYMKQEGFEFNGKHHEIYLSDARKTAPNKLKTILRQPIK